MGRNAPDDRFDLSGWVYFVQGVTTGRVKIGFTASHPDRRFGVIQVHSPDPLRKLGVVLGTLETERILHRRFRPLNTHAEWFAPHPSLLEFIRAEVLPWPGIGAESGRLTYEESRRLNDDWARRSFSDLAAIERAQLARSPAPMV